MDCSAAVTIFTFNIKFKGKYMHVIRVCRECAKQLEKHRVEIVSREVNSVADWLAGEMNSG